MTGKTTEEACGKLGDPFAAARRNEGIIVIDVADDRIPLILRHRDVRAAARDWSTYSSDAPFRVPVPSEEAVRSVRQLPIETDPPQHTEFRKLLEPIFRRPQSADYNVRIDALVGELLAEAYAADTIEVVREFALPLQSRALALLLGMSEDHARIWIGWGTHIFHYTEGDGGGDVIDRYLREQIARAGTHPDGEDFFCQLERMLLNGRPLTLEQKLGIANLTFAGGRDTVINAVAGIIVHFATDPEAVRAVADTPKAINLAVEEYARAISPLTFIGRVCPAQTMVGPMKVQADSQVGLCWASANYDPDVFDAPTTLDLRRSPNPHVAFGSGHHSCLGAHQARAILRCLVRNLAHGIRAVSVVDAVENVERQSSYDRSLGYRRLVCSFSAETADG
jgi:cytochrome P450